MRREREREWGFEVKSVGDCVCSVNSALWGTQTSESELEMRRIWIKEGLGGSKLLFCPSIFLLITVVSIISFCLLFFFGV